MTDPTHVASKEMMQPFRFYVVKEPRKIPRVGLPIGDIDKSIDEWIAANPHAEILIVTLHGAQPRPGEIEVQLASEYVHIREAMRECGYVPETEDDE